LIKNSIQVIIFKLLMTTCAWTLQANDQCFIIVQILKSSNLIHII